MNEKERKEIIYLAIGDLYHEISSSVTHLLLLREFLRDVLEVKEEGKDMYYDLPSVYKYKNK
jgi:hypothetical protein